MSGYRKNSVAQKTLSWEIRIKENTMMDREFKILLLSLRSIYLVQELLTSKPSSNHGQALQKGRPGEAHQSHHQLQAGGTGMN